MITLINPPSPWLINQKAFPPLGLLYLASSLEWNDFDVSVLDLANKEDSLDYELLEIDTSEPIFITSTTPQYPQAKLINSIIKSINPNAVTIIGGAHATSEPETCLKDGFNHVVIGEGEDAAVHICEAYESGKKVKKTLKFPERQDLDSLPFPDRSIIDIESYGYPLDTGIATTIITSRGCPFQCAFCAKGTMSNRVRFHTPKYIETELRDIIDTYGFKNFLFVDDCFTMGKSRLEQILERIKPLEINWRCYARADQMNKDILTRMKAAGCVSIGIGIESGSQRILDSVGKSTSVEKNYKLIRDMKDVGIKSEAFIIIGLPGETYETVEETRKFMEISRPDKWGLNCGIIPYKDTPIYKDPERFDIKIYNMSPEESWAKGKETNKSFVSTSMLSRKEIERLYKENFEYFVKLTGWKPGVGYVK